MRKNIGICILTLGILVIILFLAILAVSKDEKIPQNTEITTSTETEDAVISSLEQPPMEYYIMEDHGRLCVYLSDRTTLYTETGIPTWTLPEELRAQLSDGIGFATEQELYDFLESYSS